ncbi:MAG: hypothetical protein GY928_25525 [Colwellia sp.]|nr:hypothetical protein [Colwellia sp.]
MTYIKCGNTFKNRKDDIEFVKYTESIHISEMATNLKIHMDIIECIALFATGHIEQCNMENCSSTFGTLMEDDDANGIVKDTYYQESRCCQKSSKRRKVEKIGKFKLELQRQI